MSDIRGSQIVRPIFNSGVDLISQCSRPMGMGRFVTPISFQVRVTRERKYGRFLVLPAKPSDSHVPGASNMAIRIAPPWIKSVSFGSLLGCDGKQGSFVHRFYEAVS